MWFSKAQGKPFPIQFGTGQSHSEYVNLDMLYILLVLTGWRSCIIILFYMDNP